MLVDRIGNKPRQLAVRAVMGAMVIVMLWTAWGSFQQQSISLRTMSPAWAGTAALLYATFCVANAWGWSLVLEALDHPLRPWEAICVWVRCESLRWLPGSIWNYGARAVEATQRGVPRLTCASSMMLELLFAVGSRLLIVSAVGTLWSEDLRPWWTTIRLDRTSSVACAGVVFTGITGLWILFRARVRHPIRPNPVAPHLRGLLALLNGEGCAGGRLAMVQCFYVATCLLHGFGFCCVVNCVHPHSAVPTAVLIGINAAAWLVGFFAVFAPGGLVVREAFLAAALAGWFSSAESIAIAVGWRILQIMVEAVVLIAVLTLERACAQEPIPSIGCQESLLEKH